MAGAAREQAMLGASRRFDALHGLEGAGCGCASIPDLQEGEGTGEGERERGRGHVT